MRAGWRGRGLDAPRAAGNAHGGVALVDFGSAVPDLARTLAAGTLGYQTPACYAWSGCGNGIYPK